jgi:hypothetical protein
MSFLLMSPEQHFTEVLQEACKQRKIKSFPMMDAYLVHLLKHYLDSKNLFTPFQDDSIDKPPQTLAEMYLVAMNSETPKNREIMKILADRTLYLTGFFGDSLQRKIVDIDYYTNIGSAAYHNLAVWTKEDTVASIYKTFSSRFMDFVEVLSYISEKSSVQTDQNVLRLYERYIKTGSELAREKLTALGIATLPKDQLKINKA